MGPLDQLGSALANSLADWQHLRVADLLFGRRDAAVMTLVALLGVAVAVLIGRSAVTRKPGQGRLGLPALLSWARTSHFSFIRHGALVVAAAGVPFFVLALADPYTSLTKQDVSFPGRRIALMIDASSSMLTQFPTTTLGRKAPNKAQFFATVAAAETFIRQRMKGKYRDLIALVEFGDQAYVVTPFTSDYDNILLSLSLIGDWSEYLKFPDQGTTIAAALEQSVSLFRTFDFLNASGNLMVMFSDGQDNQVTIHGRDVNDILSDAVQTKIPVYLVRVGYNKDLGGVIPDQIWKPAVERTGGRFYAASDEATILRAIREIDELSAGRIQTSQYSTEQPMYSPFALIAAAFWTAALLLKLTVPYFQRFP